MRKTIVINPENDLIVKKVQTELKKQGYNVSYSKALNITLIIGVLSIIGYKHLFEGKAGPGVFDMLKQIKKGDVDEIVTLITRIWITMKGLRRHSKIRDPLSYKYLRSRMEGE